MKKDFAVLCFIVLHLPGCVHRSERTLTKRISFIKREHVSMLPKKEPLTITIWIHGTRFSSRSIFKTLFNNQHSLIRIADVTPNYRLHRIGKALYTAAPYRFNPQHVYAFGWSGRLSFDHRECAAERLRILIHEKVAEYLQHYGTKPRVRIISHSHGGNVVLNMARTQQCMPAPPITVDELILLACPVQLKTSRHIKDPMFKKIYALYSRLDLFQIIDPQGLYYRTRKIAKRELKLPFCHCPFFSQRCFPPQDNLKQIKIKVDGRAISHMEFIKTRFLHMLPSLIDEIDPWDNVPTPCSTTNTSHKTSHQLAIRTT